MNYPLDNKIEWYEPERWQTGGRDDPALQAEELAEKLRQIEEAITDIEETPGYPGTLPRVIETIREILLGDGGHNDTDP